MNKTEIRSTIRAAAEERGVRYRITADGEVHFYGPMPGSTETGWYLVGQDAGQVARMIKRGEI